MKKGIISIGLIIATIVCLWIIWDIGNSKNVQATVWTLPTPVTQDDLVSVCIPHWDYFCRDGRYIYFELVWMDASDNHIKKVPYEYPKSTWDSCLTVDLSAAEPGRTSLSVQKDIIVCIINACEVPGLPTISVDDVQFGCNNCG